MSKGFAGVNGNRIRANEYNSLHINTWEASGVVRKLVVVVDGRSLLAFDRGAPSQGDTGHAGLLVGPILGAQTPYRIKRRRVRGLTSNAP